MRFITNISFDNNMAAVDFCSPIISINNMHSGIYFLLRHTSQDTSNVDHFVLGGLYSTGPIQGSYEVNGATFLIKSKKLTLGFFAIFL